MKVTINATDSTVRLAKEAYAIQDACNLCGLAQRFAQVMIELGDESGTRVRNQHVITKMWIDKFCDLAGVARDLGQDYWDKNKALMEGRDVEIEVC